MKRAWLVIFGVAIAMMVTGAWWLLRDTPEKALRDGLLRFFSTRSIGSLRLDVAWTDPEKRVTAGWTAVGQADISNVTHPDFFGVLFFGAGVLDDREHTADVVLVDDAIAIRPIDVSESLWSEYDRVVVDSARKTFLRLDRDALLDRMGRGDLKAGGSSTATRAVLPSFASVVRISGPWQVASSGGQSYATVPFSLDHETLAPFLLALTRAWKGSALSAAEIQRVQRSATEFSRGSYRLTVDQRTRYPVIFDATWPQLDERLQVVRRFTVRVEAFALQASTRIALPTPSVDGTAAVFGLPADRLTASEERAFILAPTGTAPASDSAPSISDEERFSRYLDELQRRKRQ